MSFFPSKALPAALLVCGLAACGDDEESPHREATTASTGGGGTGGSDAQGTGGGGAPPGECQVLTALDTSVELYTYASFAVAARVDHPIDGYAKTRLNLELYPAGEEPPAAGTYDLSMAPDDSYATCEHCILMVAYDEAGQPRRAFFQESGTMTVTKYDSDDWFVAAGEVSDVRLVEVTQNADLSWNVVPGGLCFDLPTWSFDTTPVDGGACQTNEDCPNEGMQVCDVDSKTCAGFQCSLFGDPPVCDAGYQCMSQYGFLIDREEAGPAGGACYEGCTPDGAGQSASCGSTSATCFALDSTQTYGICLENGGPAIGEACTPSDVATGCAQGAICTGEPPSCQAICDYLTPTPECPNGTYCSILNLCEPLGIGDVAPVGQTCAPGTPTLTDCGPEGDAFRGLCFRLFESEPDAVCHRTCRTAEPDCPGGLECIGVFTNTEVGICADPGSCGDGILDLLGAEVCDDGNTTSGDGCSGDCSTPELAPLCAMATPLVPGEPIVDSNEGGITGYTSLCDPFIANPTKTYSFLPPAPGELTLHLTSVPDLGVSVLADCLDTASEIDCRMDEADDILHINFPTVPAQPILVVVRGYTPLETGFFLLQSEFVVATCGDGLIGGTEACDDGNTASNDGCNADCSAVEWPIVCGALPVVEAGDVVQGNLDDGTAFFDLSELCSYESGRERAYTFVAPSNGTLTVQATGEDNISVFIRDDCGAIDDQTQLHCSNFAWEGQTEISSTTLVAGQEVTIIVDAFTREGAGAFTMNVSFAP